MMQQELLSALVELVKEGGTLALWGVFVWFLMQIIKVGVIGGILWGIVRSLCHLVQRIYSAKLDFKEKQVPIISEQASSTVISCLDSYQNSVNKVLERIDSQLEKLKTK